MREKKLTSEEMNEIIENKFIEQYYQVFKELTKEQKECCESLFRTGFYRGLEWSENFRKIRIIG